MRIISDMVLRGFEFWGGAKDFAEQLTPAEIDRVDMLLDDEYPEGLTDTELNDLFWFDRELIASLLDITEEEIWDRR